jgi:ribosomal protein L11 methyltransferase
VSGIDIDPQAVTAARDNAARNDVVCTFGLPEATPAPGFDVLVANILTNPLKALAPLLASQVRPGGRICLSGILAAQADAVTAVYSEAFEMKPYGLDEGWVCLEGRRRC